ncbi:MAG: pyridoxal phosphate-dependent aminotransferase [Acidobacteriota bacterium]
MRFSSRTGWELGENDLSVAVREARASGRELFDLTVSNPTACGFAYDAERLLAPLARASAISYEPDPLGMMVAREAVAAYYRDHGADVPMERICLTTSTSEAYSFLFRLLCDPGDEVLIARPSYPLFDYIAQLDDVKLREYPLLYDPGAAGDDAHAWAIDLHALETAIGPKTRAVIVVHPNNPTGNFASAAERAALEELCSKHGLALIVDEVFLDYGFGSVAAETFATGGKALCFVLSGLSKICGLPQMKASWIAACGPDDLSGKAMARLEVIADTFLSMNAPVQHALPVWLARRRGLQQQIRERVAGNLEVLDRRVAGTSAQRLAMQGGWAAVVRVPRDVDQVPFVEAALGRGVVVQPGEFYGLPAGRIVLSLLTSAEVWARGLERLPVD